MKRRRNRADSNGVNTGLIASNRALQGAERRRSARQSIVRAAKLVECRGVRYWSAETVDASESGFLLRVRGEGGNGREGGFPKPGTELRIGVAWGGQGFLRSGELIDGGVVRAVRAVGAEGAAGEMLVAVELKVARVVLKAA